MSVGANGNGVDQDAYEEGYSAAQERKTFNEACPYTFIRSGCLARGDYNGFEREYRPKLNSWFSGWKAWLDERGLGFNFEPHRTRSTRT